MKILKFDHTTLCFHKGTNTTFRRFGTGLVPGFCRICKTCKSGGLKWIYDGEITNIQIFRFQDTPKDLFVMHHSGLGKYRIFTMMQNYYKGFHFNEVVLAVSFVPYFSEKIDDLPF